MELTTIDTNNYAEMAKAMGIANEGGTNKKKSSNLARLRINHSPITGNAEVKGKKVKMEAYDTAFAFLNLLERERTVNPYRS